MLVPVLVVAAVYHAHRRKAALVRAHLAGEDRGEIMPGAYETVGGALGELWTIARDYGLEIDIRQEERARVDDGLSLLMGEGVESIHVKETVTITGRILGNSVTIVARRRSIEIDIAGPRAASYRLSDRPRVPARKRRARPPGRRRVAAGQDVELTQISGWLRSRSGGFDRSAICGSGSAMWW